MSAFLPRPSRSITSETTSLPRWLTAVVVLGAMLTAAGGLIALIHPTLLLAHGDHMNDAARFYARYLVSRNLALALMLIVTLGSRAIRPLATLMLLTALIQLLDIALDAAAGAYTLIPGLVIFTVLFLIGARRLIREETPGHLNRTPE